VLWPLRRDGFVLAIAAKVIRKSEIVLAVFCEIAVRLHLLQSGDSWQARRRGGHF
jgi:hypothetical protein